MHFHEWNKYLIPYQSARFLAPRCLLHRHGAEIRSSLLKVPYCQNWKFLAFSWLQMSRGYVTTIYVSKQSVHSKVHTACIKYLWFFTSPCDFRKNVMSELLSPPSVTIPSTTLRPFAKPPDSIASMPCWATTTRKHVEKVHFKGRNQIGRPVTLHSHSKDLTGLLLWGGSRQTHRVNLVMMM